SPVQRSLEPDEHYLQLSSGNCDCGTVLGSLRRLSDRSSRVSEQAAKLRRRGWSESRIERTLAARADAARQRVQARHARFGDAHLDADQWLSLLRELIAASGAAYVGLLLHWYAGSVEAEPIAIRRREAVALDAVTADFLLWVEEDVLYVFTR